jgi:hypothetical protein
MRRLLRLFAFKVVSLMLVGTAWAQVGKIDALAVAIARTEGFYVARTIPHRLHNPGDIRSTSLHAYAGQRGLYHGYVVFKTDRDGWTALRAQLQRIVDGTSKRYTIEMPFSAVARTYAQDPRWGRTVCRILGITPQTTVAEYFDLAPRFILTGAPDATTLRLYDGRAHSMPELQWVSEVPTYLL